MVCSDADYAKEMAYLKAKVDAGADCIITQMFFDPEVYGDFLAACRAAGITVPVIPGVMCLQNFNGFKKMGAFCKTRTPRELEIQMEAAHSVSEEAVRQLGISFGKKMCERLLELGAPGLHFYTLNLEKVTYGILEAMEAERRETQPPSLASRLISSSILAAASATTILLLSKLAKRSATAW